MTNNGKKENTPEQKNILIEKEIEAVKILLNGWSRQIILTGPPGTSKTYSAKRIANCLIEMQKEMQPGKPVDDGQIRNHLRDWNGKATINRDDPRCDIVQFHPSYNYEDFVRGIEVIPNENAGNGVEVKPNENAGNGVEGKPNPSGGITYKTVDKILGKMAKHAMKSALNLDSGKEAPLHVLIIDEINRAPLASVLGELIYALEYRGDSVTTPYTVDNSPHLEIPDNLIIIGTMNTADRSIGSIDYAVRRRFTFINLPPDEEVIKNQKEQDAPKEKALRLFDAVSTLFGKKDNDESNDKNETNGNGYMDPEFYAEDVQIGHTYFLAKSDAELKHKFIYQVIPVLKEYIKDGILINNPCLKFKITTSPTSSPTNTTDKPIYLSESFNKIKGEIESCWSKIYVG